MEKIAKPLPVPQQIKEAFLELAVADSTEMRDRLINRFQTEDPQLADEVRALLKASRAGNVIEQLFGLVPDPALAGTNISEEDPSPKPAARSHAGIVEKPGTVLGPYKLLEQIGEGGMGTVFHAQQSRPIRRRVALKIIKPGMDTGQVVARFEAERQALALMDHPNIAKVLDAGATEQGRPYFVMELVKGIPITDYCNQEKLDTDRRLKLFIDVCHGVQHAHQKGIIHRDLKPGNILITLHDGKPVVKIIDFGIAKAIDQELTERTLFTQVSLMIGTPLYMSPEQAEVSGLDIDTRSDVYSLGVLLYELLTGTTPFDRESMKKVGIDEVRRMIRETEPPRPSQRFSTLKAGNVATSGSTQSRDLKRSQLELQGELDWIVMKALEKDRNRRYESASAFANDVQRYLSDEPVRACPPTLTYRLQKFTKRNRALLITGVLLVAMLLVATGVSASYAVKSQRASQDADLQRDAAMAAQKLSEKRLQQSRNDVNRALKSLDTIVQEVSSEEFAQLSGVDRVRDEILNKALSFYEEIISEHDNDPHAREQQALAYANIDEISIGRNDRTLHLQQLNQSIELLEKIVQENPNKIQFQVSLTIPLFARLHSPLRTPEERLADAERCLETIKRRQNTEYEAAPNESALIHYKVAENLPVDSPRARQLVETAIQITESHGMPPVPPTQIWLADRAVEQGELEAAVKYYQRGIELFELMAADPEKRRAYIERWLAAVETAKLASVYEKLNQTPQAEQAYRLAVTSARQLFQEYHATQLVRDAFPDRMIQLTDFLVRQGRAEEARVLLDDLLRDIPASDRLHLARAKFAEELQEFDLALDHHNEAVLAAPDDHFVIRERALFFLRRGDHHAALVDLNRSLKLGPTEWWLVKRRGAVHFELGDFQMALADLALAVEQNPGDVSTITWIAVEKVAACPSPEFRAGMVRLADHCVKLNNYSPASLIQRAALLSGLGELEKASQDLHAVVTSGDVTYYEDYQAALLLLVKLGDFEGYKACCLTMVNARTATAKPIASCFGAWTCALAPNSLDDYSVAIALSRAAVAAEPTNSDFLRSLGAILMRAGMFGEAKSYLEEAVTNPDDKGASKAYKYFFLAMTEHHLGNAAAARTHLTTANDLADKELTGSVGWNRKLTIELLRTEAQILIGDTGQ